MAISSFPFDNQDSTESQYSALFRELQGSGVADTHGGAGLRVDIAGGMNVTVQPGFALVRGHAFQSTAGEPKAIPAATSSTVTHVVVLRLDPTANTITIEIVSGVANGGAPALALTDTALYEIPLATIIVPPSTVNIDPLKLTDSREFLGEQPRAWSTGTRPASPRKSRLGYNATTAQWEFWDGSKWTYVVSPDTYTRLGALEDQPYIGRKTPERANLSSVVFPKDEWWDLDWRFSDTGQNNIDYVFGDGKFIIKKAGLYRYDLTFTWDNPTLTGARHAKIRSQTSGDFDYDGKAASQEGWTTNKLGGEKRLAVGESVVTSVMQNSFTTIGIIAGQAYQHVSLRRVGA